MYSNQIFGSYGHAILTWYAAPWVKDKTSAKYGAPVLININRLLSNYVFRGDIVTASYLPMFLHGCESSTGSIYARSWGNTNFVTADTYDMRPGWAAISGGQSRIFGTTTATIPTPVTAARETAATARGLVYFQPQNKLSTGTVPVGTSVNLHWNPYSCQWDGWLGTYIPA